MTDNEDFDKTIKETETTLSELDQIIDIQKGKMDVLMKKSATHTVLWGIVTAIVYYIWQGMWYYWIVLAITIMTLASLIFILVMRSKLHKKMNQHS